MKHAVLKAALVLAIASLGMAPARPAAATEVLMALWRGETESEAAFRERLNEIAGPVTFTVVDGNQDRSNLASQLRALDDAIGSGKFKVAYTYGTTVTQTAGGIINGRMPTVFNIVAAPVEAKLVNSMEKPGRPVTGVTNGVPIQEQFEALSKIAKIEKLALFFNAREPNSNILEEKIQDWAQAKSVKIHAFRVIPGSGALDDAIADLAAGRTEADTLFLPADTYLASEAKKIVAGLGKKLRIYGSTETFVLRGALAAYAPEVADMGRVAADIAARVIKGEDAGTIAVVLPTPRLFVSKSAAAALGITVPEGAVTRN